ncbi:transposase [Rhodococcus aetherivorans]|uniref:IS110 family transposase n=1 Tax=Rhodococcus aetherivorans TaxID=191292 RepID=UPI0036722989
MWCGSWATRPHWTLQLEEAGEHPEVVLEATYGWYWAVDTLQAAGASVYLAHPLRIKGFRYRRVKSDVRDAVRGSGGSVANAPTAGGVDGTAARSRPQATRELRELVRHHTKLVVLRSGLKAQVHAVLAKVGGRSRSRICSGSRAARSWRGDHSVKCTHSGRSLCSS